MILAVRAGQATQIDAPRLQAITGASESVPGANGTLWLRNARLSETFVQACRERRLDWARFDRPRRLNEFGLFVTDMDSTLINVECIDEIAAMHGRKAEVARITEAAMRGEIDFVQSLRQRVAALAGLHEQALQSVFDERVRLNAGAERLMRTLKDAGIYTVLVSGGFTFYTDRLKQQLGFDEAHANHLEIENGQLTGRVQGAIIDAAAKARCLERARAHRCLAPSQTLVAGDGANDLQMLRAAGLAVAFRAKPLLQDVADCWLEHGPLDGIVDFLNPPASL